MSDEIERLCTLLEAPFRMDTFLQSEEFSRGWERQRLEAAAALRALQAENERLREERDEAVRRRDAWKARAAGCVEMADALRAKTAGKDSRTLGRSLLGAAKMEAEARAEAAEAALVEARAEAFEEAAKVAESPKTELFLDEWTAGQCSAAIHTMISMAAAIRALAAKD